MLKIVPTKPDDNKVKALLGAVKDEATGGIFNFLKDQMVFKFSFHLYNEKFEEKIIQAMNPSLVNSLEWRRGYVYGNENTKNVIAGPFVVGTGMQVLNFGNFLALMSTEEADNKDKKSWVEKTLQRTIYTFMWDRDKLLDVVRSCLDSDDTEPMVRKYSCGTETMSKQNLKYANQQQFVGDTIYDEIDSVFQQIINDPDYFIKNGKERKATILLQGPPGTGKSSLIRHFIAKYKCDVNRGTPADFKYLLTPFDRITNSPLVVIIEEIDGQVELCIDDGKDTINIATDGVFNYGEFIDWLDGYEPLSNVIIFLTTNNRDIIKPNVLRNGRVDRKIFVDYLTVDELTSYIGEQWREEISQYEKGKITISMIPDLRNSVTSDDFHQTVKVLSEH